MRGRRCAWGVGILLAAAVGTSGAAAEPPGGAWLDAPEPPAWNRPGARVPQAPRIAPDAFLAKQCAPQVRKPSTPGDRAVAAAGWQLVGASQRFGDTEVVTAQSSVDGMCRPLGYQVFVFRGGRFAGTLSPRPMDARTDGSAQVPSLFSADGVTLVFSRYGPDDPLCCPSRLSTVQYRIERRKEGPVVVATVVGTAPTATASPPPGAAPAGMCTPAPVPAPCELPGATGAVLEQQPAPGQEGPTSGAERCTRSGGTVEQRSCCRLVGDFPSTCLLGACGCAPGDSHAVRVCRCPAGRCFDGKSCVPAGAPPGGQLR